MISILLFGFGFVLGMLTGQGKLNWVAGVAGKARGFLLGSVRTSARRSNASYKRQNAPDVDNRLANEAFSPDIQPALYTSQEAQKQRSASDLGDSPNPTSDPTHIGYTHSEVAGQGHNDRNKPIEVVTQTPSPPKRLQLEWYKALRNIIAFFVGLLSWCARNPIVALGLVILALWLVMGSPFGFGKSKDALRLEREIAEANTRIAEHEARLEGLAGTLAVNTERDRTRRTQIITQAQQEIEDATAQVDPDAQYAAYVRGYLCLLDASACESGANPAPSGTNPVRSSSPDAA